jgi:hypothetical protein
LLRAETSETKALFGRAEPACYRFPGAFFGSHFVQFMVIETFRNQDAKSVYRRFRDKGRMVPDGITFVSSWVSADLDRCFQIMECDDITLLQRWVTAWSDLVEFEVIPVSPGKSAAPALQTLI